MIWNELYRVDTLADIKGQDYNIQKLQAIVRNMHTKIDDGDCPNMFFFGKHGTGKTASVYAFLKDAFGPSWRENFMEKNASEVRIEQIRESVISFSEKPPYGTYNAPNGDEYFIPFNIIFMDEIDYLGPKSQAILRRVMEQHANHTRFILSCNYRHKVISALQSRCMVFTFKPIKPKFIIEILKPIIKEKNIDIDDDALMLIARACGGDARASQNILHKCSLTGTIDTDEVKRATNMVFEAFNTNLLKQVLIATNSKDNDYDKSFKVIENKIDKMYYEGGISGVDIVMNIFDSVNNDSAMPINIKRAIFGEIGKCMADCPLADNDLYTVKMWLRKLKL